MPEFLVTWEIDIEADTPVEAAEQARQYQTNPNSRATVFEVTDKASLVTRTIDLTEIDEDLDLCRDCGADYEQGGDGYNGRCPDCADIAEEEGRADD